MIDYEKELEKFDFFEIDKEFIDLRNETNKSVQAFNSTVKKFRKEQSDVVFQVEEIIEVLDEIKSGFNKSKNLEKTIVDNESEKLLFVKGLISILDQFEDFYKFMNSSDNTWKSQFDMVWKNIENILMSMGISRIENINTIFNSKINSAKSVVNNDFLQEGMITEVLRCGYMYKSNIIRKAEVVINKNSKEGEINE